MDVNQKELAAILGITDRRIRELRSDYGLFNGLATAGKGRKIYSLEKCVPEYIRYKIEAEVQGGTNRSKEEEQTEHEQIKKQISMLRLKKLKGELHEARDVEEFLTGMLISFKNRLLTIPQKVTPLVIGEDDSNIILGIIEKEIYEALDQLSEYDPEKIDKDNYLEEEEEEEEGKELAVIRKT